MPKFKGVVFLVTLQVISAGVYAIGIGADCKLGDEDAGEEE